MNTGKAEATPKARRVPEAAKAIGISRGLVYKLARNGKIKLVKIGRTTVVPESEINRILQEGV